MPTNIPSLLSMQAFNGPGQNPLAAANQSPFTSKFGVGTGLLVGSQIAQGVSTFFQGEFNAGAARTAQQDVLNAFNLNEPIFEQRDRHFTQAPLAEAGASGIRTTGAPLVVSNENMISAQRDALNRKYQMLLEQTRFKNIESLEEQRGLTSLLSSLVSGAGIGVSSFLRAGA